MAAPVTLLAVLVLFVASPCGAFGLFPEYFASADVQQRLERAARWTGDTGLQDGLQVGVEPGLAAELQLPGEEIASIEDAVLRGIGAWESPALHLDITLDAEGVAEGTGVGFEIDLFAVPGTHPAFVGNGFYGRAQPATELFDARELTNGQVFPGYAITGVDVFLNVDRFAELAPLGASRLDVLTRVVIHEFGHAIGLGHPNDDNPFGAQLNYDTDLDPTNEMWIDPSDPFGALIVSPNPDNTAIMSNAPCGPDPIAPCPAIFYTALRADDRGGRDVLYPVPEPGSAALLGAALFGGLLGGRRAAARGAERHGALRTVDGLVEAVHDDG